MLDSTKKLYALKIPRDLQGILSFSNYSANGMLE
jgi:hypothetical protein